MGKVRLEVSVRTTRRYLNKLADEGKAKWNGEGWVAEIDLTRF